MGMFNRIYVDCPECDNCVEFQSKSGDCTLSGYHITQMPREDFAGIYGDEVACQVCGTVVSIGDSEDTREDFSKYVFAE